MILPAIQQLGLLPHKRLWAGLLCSVLVHAVLLLPFPAAPTLTLRIPAPELAIAFAADHRMATLLKPVARQLAAAETIATEPPANTSSASLASDAATNHLHSLLHESLNRYFIYPALAHRNGWEGRVELLVHLAPDGRLQVMRVVRSSGYALLDDDALLTLRRIGSIPQARAWLPEQGYATTLPVVYKLTEG